MLEQRNKEYHAECSNTSVIAARMSFKEMVGERAISSRQLETSRSLTSGRAAYRTEHPGGTAPYLWKSGWGYVLTAGTWKEQSGHCQPLAMILGICLCSVYAFRTMCSTNSGSAPLSQKECTPCTKEGKRGTLIRVYLYSQATWVWNPARPFTGHITLDVEPYHTSVSRSIKWEW